MDKLDQHKNAEQTAFLSALAATSGNFIASLAIDPDTGCKTNRDKLAELIKEAEANPIIDDYFISMAKVVLNQMDSAPQTKL